jgi:hypothetical protein
MVPVAEFAATRTDCEAANGISEQQPGQIRLNLSKKSRANAEPLQLSTFYTHVLLTF